MSVDIDPAHRESLFERFLAHQATDVLLHERLRHDDLTMASAKMQALCSVSLLGLVPVIVVPYFHYGYYMIGGLMCGFAFLAACSLPVLKFVGSRKLAAHMHCLAILGATVSFTMLMGGLQSGGLEWFAVGPVMALVFGGRKIALIWLALCVAAYLLIFLGLSHGWLQAVQIFTPDIWPFVQFINGVAFVCTMGTLVILRDSLNHWLVRKMQRHEASLSKRNEQLQQARDDAMAAQRVKARFLQNMSHELRTPMNAVIGYAEMLEEELHADEIHEYDHELGAILGSSRLFVESIADILEVSQMGMSSFELTLEEVDIQPLYAHLLEIGERFASREQNTFSATLHESWLEHPLRSDAHRLSKILKNLISNAAKFTQQGEITLTFHPILDAAAPRLITLEDTGMGIAPQDRERIWETFVQANDTSTRRHGGMGLGLGLVQHFCKQLRVHIELASELGQGTRIELRIPPTVPTEDDPRGAAP